MEFDFGVGQTCFRVLLYINKILIQHNTTQEKKDQHKTKIRTTQVKTTQQ